MILDDIVKYKRIQIEKEKIETPIKRIYESLEKETYSHRNFCSNLAGREMSIIGEIKRASPSKGVISENFDVKKIAITYEEIKVSAISVLTERNFFMGEDRYLIKARELTTRPILRKDFIIDEYQLYTSRIIGADAVLLIASLLKDKLKGFYKKASSLGLDCLIEVHNEKELYDALETNCKIIGINNRDLTDFTVSLSNTEKLIKYIPKDKIVVSESGIENRSQIKYLENLGVRAVLIGETLMKNIDNKEKLKEFVC